MKVRRAIIKDLKRVQDLYGIVSDEMAGTIYDIMCKFFFMNFTPLECNRKLCVG